ncbi:unnamed protein product [Heterobilharzia americana]|nr:unnamed protein product [Heterobilharzia americana]
MILSVLLLCLVQMVQIMCQRKVCQLKRLPSEPILGVDADLQNPRTGQLLPWSNHLYNPNSYEYKNLSATLCDAVKEAIQPMNSHIKNEKDCFLVIIRQWDGHIYAQIYLKYPISEYSRLEKTIMNSLDETMRKRNIGLQKTSIYSSITFNFRDDPIIAVFLIFKRAITYPTDFLKFFSIS